MIWFGLAWCDHGGVQYGELRNRLRAGSFGSGMVRSWRGGAWWGMVSSGRVECGKLWWDMVWFGEEPPSGGE